ncbi:MAG: hypothetical protein AB1327_08020 [Bacillota bacterium]
MNREQIVERAARVAATVGPRPWEEMTSFQRRVLCKQIAAAFDDVRYFELCEAAEEVLAGAENARNYPQGSGWAWVCDRLRPVLGGDAE